MTRRTGGVTDFSFFVFLTGKAYGQLDIAGVAFRRSDGPVITKTIEVITKIELSYRIADPRLCLRDVETIKEKS
jgi:hypothetical protein